ncbi:MAG: radical SAM protein [Candidatus Methanomethylicia archaeon]|nr:radical SAM protein [Candidatus Methanomethylicia archaeon]MDW7988560.1 radical SAM protein [Nitrososphaerota archaeon]
MKVLNKTQSLCPECLKILDAEIYVDNDNLVKIRRFCLDHGEFTEIYTFSNPDLYKWAEKYAHEPSGITTPITNNLKGCPFDCGLCQNHKSATVLAIIDVTNRCNMRCPICFANAAASGLMYEPTLDQIKVMLEKLRSIGPVPPPALQLSGGEPTVRNDLFEIIKMAKSMGFRHIEVNTNGIVLANNIDYYKSLLEAGVSTIYLQFDGLNDDLYIRLRGIPMKNIKLKVIENARKIGHESIVLVVTLTKGVNDNQIGEIIKFALDNHDVVRCVNFQPISFSGRATKLERDALRINTSDFMNLVEEQTNGLISKYDFRPVPCVVPLSRAIGALKGKRYVEFTTSPFCGVATFIIKTDEGWKPITKLADVDKFFNSMQKVYEDASKGSKGKAYLRTISSLRYVKFGFLKDLLFPVLREGSYEALGKFMRKIVMIGCMHFMDLWNFDLQRVNRCVIHYALPDGTIRPFCTHNSIHRSIIEDKFSIPIK